MKKAVLAGIIVIIITGLFTYFSLQKKTNNLNSNSNAEQIAELASTLNKNHEANSQEYKDAYKKLCALTARPVEEQEKAITSIREFLGSPDAQVDFVCSRFENNNFNNPVEESYNAGQFGFRIDPKTNLILEIADPISNTSTWGRNNDGTAWFALQPSYDYSNRYTQDQAQKIVYDYIISQQSIFGVDLSNWELDPSRVGKKDNGNKQTNYFFGWKNNNKSLTKEHEVCGDVDPKKEGAYKNANGIMCIKETSTKYQSVDVTITNGGQIIRYSNSINDMEKL